MKPIEEILLVLNNFENLSNILEKTFALAKKTNAKVSILYVYEKPLFSIEELFKNSDATLNKQKVQEYLRKKSQAYTQEDIAIIVKIDDTANQAWDIVRDDRGFLIVTPYHQAVSKELLKRLKQDIFFIKSNAIAYQKGVLVTETLLQIQESITSYQELFSKDIEIIYNFYYIPDAATLDPALTLGIDTNLELLETEEKLFEEFLQEHHLKGEFFVNALLGDITLVEYINSNNFDIIWYREDESELLIADESLEETLQESKVDIFVERVFAI